MFERFRQKKESSEETARSRHDESEHRMMELTDRSVSLPPDQILGELEKMHNSSGIALWPERGRSFYRVLERVGDNQPSKEDVSKMLSMLTWPEFIKFQDRENAQKILKIAAQAPNHEFLPILQEHLAWLEKTKSQFKSRSSTAHIAEIPEIMAAHEISGYTPIPYRADEMRFQDGIEEEIRLTNDLITACKQ